MDQFIPLYDQYYYVFGLVLALVQLVLIIAVVRLQSRVSKLKRLNERLFRDAHGGSLEKLLETHMDRVRGNSQRIEDLSHDFRGLAQTLREAIQHVGLVRFNPFEDMGSDQSFSVAFLDDFDNGLVITSLHSRTSARVYAKPIQKGQPLYPLSNEEKEAIESARKKVPVKQEYKSNRSE